MADKFGLKGSVKRLIQHLYPEGLFELPTPIQLTFTAFTVSDLKPEFRNYVDLFSSLLDVVKERYTNIRRRNGRFEPVSIKIITTLVKGKIKQRPVPVPPQG